MLKLNSFGPQWGSIYVSARAHRQEGEAHHFQIHLHEDWQDQSYERSARIEVRAAVSLLMLLRNPNLVPR